MERKVLVNEIIGFCFEYRLFDKLIEIDEIKDKIEIQLGESEFIESLINTIIVKTKKNKNRDNEKLKELLLELEKIRLELEYKE